MLERLGYRVTQRTSSLEALEAFRFSSDKFDLVITDLMMPNMTGEKLALELKHICKEVPVILCTGFSEKMSKEKAEALGIDGFLMKPIVRSELAQKIRTLLDMKKKRIKLHMTHILIIDDEQPIRLILRKLVESEGYTVTEASNGIEGIKSYHENPADLIIIDIIMPDKQGIQTIRELKKEYPDVKIIAISGGGKGTPDGYLNLAKKSGAMQTIEKPIRKEELLKAIKNLI